MDVSEIFKRFASRAAHSSQIIQSSTEPKFVQNQIAQRQNNVKLIDLKLSSNKPELVQYDDVNAPDPEFLAFLREQPNTVDIPRHWRVQKGSFLSQKLSKGSFRHLKNLEFRIPKQYMKAALERKNALDKIQEQTFQQLARNEIKVNQQETLYEVREEEYADNNEYLPFGQVFYQGRLTELKFKYDFTKGELSDRLKHAIQYKEGEDAPWTHKRKILGLE
ncbi:Conserved_hypothetical protein [Hexamita inflata]|uniref:DUF382 domain-containing protein n=1 Tax=Hexamita inflata TaxID=28002 RepID=A0AA86Q6C4_9EUKA|nr:Conserved hypothetical protein [Hexamita inflata]